MAVTDTFFVRRGGDQGGRRKPSIDRSAMRQAIRTIIAATALLGASFASAEEPKRHPLAHVVHITASLITGNARVSNSTKIRYTNRLKPRILFTYR